MSPTEGYAGLGYSCREIIRFSATRVKFGGSVTGSSMFPMTFVAMEPLTLPREECASPPFRSSYCYYGTCDCRAISSLKWAGVPKTSRFIRLRCCGTGFEFSLSRCKVLPLVCDTNGIAVSLLYHSSESPMNSFYPSYSWAYMRCSLAC